MSKEAVQAIIGRAVVDVKFRETLFTDPDLALAEFELTVDEFAALKAIDAESMESFAGALDERISKAAIAGSTGDSSGAKQVRMLDPELAADVDYFWGIFPV